MLRHEPSRLSFGQAKGLSCTLLLALRLLGLYYAVDVTPYPFVRAQVVVTPIMFKHRFAVKGRAGVGTHSPIAFQISLQWIIKAALTALLIRPSVGNIFLLFRPLPVHSLYPTLMAGVAVRLIENQWRFVFG